MAVDINGRQLGDATGQGAIIPGGQMPAGPRPGLAGEQEQMTKSTFDAVERAIASGKLVRLEGADCTEPPSAPVMITRNPVSPEPSKFR